MNIQTATPVEIDTELAEISGRAAKPAARLAGALHSAKQIRKALESGGRTYYTQENLDRALESAKTSQAELDAIVAEADPFNAEFARRGGWTRFFLVKNNNGHVHSSMSCQTCFADTLFAWLPEFSGQDEAGVVELAGESACTVCFPSSPVDVLKRRSQIELPERKAARLEREAAAAAKAAKKAVNEIPAVRVHGVCGMETITNKRTATTWAVDNIADAHFYSREREHLDDFDAVVAVLAEKDGVDVAAKLAEITKKAEAKIRKSDREVAEWASRSGR